MKNIFLLSVSALIFFAACKKDNVSKNHNNNSRKIDTLQGSITADRTLDGNKDYFLKGQVFVKANSTLTIPAGITVFAQKNYVPADKAVLVITRGSKIFINGTADSPKIFLS